MIKDARPYKEESNIHMTSTLREALRAIILELDAFIDEEANERGLRRGHVPSRLPCSLLIAKDQESIHILAERTNAAPIFYWASYPARRLSADEIADIAQADYDLQVTFSLAVPAATLDMTKGQREATLRSIAVQHVDREYNRVVKARKAPPFLPLFGPPPCEMQPNLVFVLMPFEAALTRIYETVLRPAIEERGLVCRRADDYKTSKAIIHNIWRAICEARIILADLTGLNPNVLYELGIAHTVGKDTIIIYQRGGETQRCFPFDLQHIQRIEYDDSASGGQILKSELFATLKTVLSRSKGQH